MSTLELSRALAMSVPRPPVPATPMLAGPAPWLSLNRFDPDFTNPFGLLKFARASCPTLTVRPAPKLAVIVPSAEIATLLSWPGADPFWLTEDVADADEYPVIADTLLAPTMSQLNVLAAAPLAHVGV